MAAFLTRKRLSWSSVSKAQVLQKAPRRNGYIVLLPETLQTQQIPDPFQSKTSGLPDIDNLSTEKCVSMIGKFALDFESGLWKLEEKLKDSDPQTFDVFTEVLDPLEHLSAPLDATWGLMKTLFLSKSSLIPENSYMSIHDRARRARSQKFNSKVIYTACKSAPVTGVPEAKKRVLSKFILEGSLNGLDLNAKDNLALRTILNKISQAKFHFKNKVQIATKKFQHKIYDNSIIRDFPQDLLQAMGSERGGPWIVSLQPHVYNQFMEYCPVRDLRWNAWQATVRRCSIEGDQALETSNQVEELRGLRRNQAKLLGFETFVHMSMQTKMAGSIENVRKMLGMLHKKAFAAQKREMEVLQTFAEERGFEGSLQLWDIPYWKRKQLRTLYSFDEEVLRDYFPFPHVLQQLFALCELLFGIQFVKEDNKKFWHPDVSYYHIVNVSSKSPIAGFFLDPYARPREKLGAEGSGWMVALRNRSSLCNHEPAAALLFNFMPPSDKKPSLLALRDVHVLFQKFGQALQHLLTTATYSDVAGISNVEWDAVEVCSNFMSNWLYNEKTVEQLSSHYESGECLPKETLTNVELLPRWMAGYELCQQLYHSALDLELHTSKTYWGYIIKELWPQYFTVPLQKFDAHPCSFTAIFSEEWAAAYYSHVWSRVVAADVFSAFQEVGLDNNEELANIGGRLRSTFLELGGGCHPAEVFRRFRGRDPSPNALLWSLG